MDEPAVLREDVAVETSPAGGTIRWLTLNRPRRYNALSTEMMTALHNEIIEAGEDNKVRVVIISGSGRGFCAGHDLKEVRSRPNREFYTALFALCSRMMMSIVQCPRPVIAQVHGVATAAGCQLVATCDLAVASTSARFATPGVNIGLFCSTPMVALSRNVSRKHAMEMLLTGDLIGAQRAAEIGLINQIAPDDALSAASLALAQKLAAKSPLTLKIGKEAFYRQLEVGLEEAYQYTSQVMTENMLARDAEEGIDAFLEKRPPAWTGQ